MNSNGTRRSIAAALAGAIAAAVRGSAGAKHEQSDRVFIPGHVRHTVVANPNGGRGQFLIVLSGGGTEGTLIYRGRESVMSHEKLAARGRGFRRGQPILYLPSGTGYRVNSFRYDLDRNQTVVHGVRIHARPPKPGARCVECTGVCFTCLGLPLCSGARTAD